MNNVFVIIVALSVYLDDSIINVDAQTAGVAKTPFLKAYASSTYANNDGCWGAKFAIDGYSDSSHCNFFHSKATGGYPWLEAVIAPGNKVYAATLKSRCDANGWGHTQFTVVVRVGTTANGAGTAATSLFTTKPENLCGSFTGRVGQCQTITINCEAAAYAADSTVLSVQLYTNGGNVHLMFEDIEITTAAATTNTATSSSVYYCPYGDFSAYWGPNFAIDGKQSSTWYGMFHSCHETYPWLQIALPAAATVTSVTLRSRCDANAWSSSVPNNINVEVRTSATALASTFRGQITGSNPAVSEVCNTKIGPDASACMTHKLTCAAALSRQYVTVQMLDATKTFLMLDEVTIA